MHENEDMAKALAAGFSGLYFPSSFRAERRSTPAVFTAQQGTFAKLGGDFFGLSADVSIDLGSYNTPTYGSPYVSQGVGLSVGVGPFKIGFSYAQTSNNGGLSFSPSPTNFTFAQLNATSDAPSLEVAPPQAFSGFTVTANLAQVCGQ